MTQRQQCELSRTLIPLSCPITYYNSLANQAPYKILQHLSFFPENVRNFLQQVALTNIAEQSPQDAINLLAEIPNGIQEFGSAVVSGWVSTDIRGALDWIRSQEESVQPSLVSAVLPVLVEEDPDLALYNALSQPIVDGQRGLEFEVLRLLSGIDVHRAIAMLPHVRDDETTKKATYGTIARALVRANDLDTAIELGSKLPESHQRNYFEEMIGQFQSTDKMGLYEILDKFPQPDFKSTAALVLLQSSNPYSETRHRHFSDKQIEEIKSYLSAKDAERIIP